LAASSWCSYLSLTDALFGQKTVHIVTAAAGNICYWALQGNCHLSACEMISGSKLRSHWLITLLYLRYVIHTHNSNPTAIFPLYEMNVISFRCFTYFHTEEWWTGVNNTQAPHVPS
jgi:hypothetical protein